MRILVIHTVYKQRGGEDSVVANEVELLRSMGHEVELLQFTNAGGTIGKLIQLPFNYTSYTTIKKLIKTFKPQVVHVHNLHFAGSASVIYALHKYQLPVVITLHNYRLLCPSATLFNNGKLFTKSVHKEFTWDATLRGVYQNSRLITFWVSFSMWLHQKLNTWTKPSAYIALGQFTKDIFADSKLGQLKDRIAIKPNFCYPNEQASIAPDKNAYLYIGRLSEEKGITVLLKAFAANKLPLIIAGIGPLEGDVVKAAKQHQNIEFLGLIAKEIVNELLANTRALIFPSLWYETFGMVIIEAFAAGTPVIASDLGQLKFTVTDHYNGLHFETDNAESLQEKIKYFNSLNAKAYSTYRKNALETYKEYYSAENNGKLLLNIYTNIAGRVDN